MSILPDRKQIIERSTNHLTIAMCTAEVLNMGSIFAFSALLPHFLQEWQLTHTQAGWINGIYFAGYSTAVPLLASVTDRVDARRIYLWFTLVSIIASLLFAVSAQGFWTALFLRALAGLGLAGTFIPGLKALVDRLHGNTQARAIALYTATFSFGTSLSFFFTGVLTSLLGWRFTFVSMAGFGLIALFIATTTLRPKIIQRPDTHVGTISNIHSVLCNHRSMRYILAYACHMWELFSARSWMVVFLSFSLSLQTETHGYWTPTSVAALAGLIAMWASVGGAELALRFGRRRVLKITMWTSALMACIFGFTALLPYPLVILLCIVYMSFVQGDSATLHTGAILSAPPGRRGVTMAVQSMIGFGSAFLGPVAVGVVLGLTGGGRTIASWGAAFISMGAIVAIGPVILASLTGQDVND